MTKDIQLYSGDIVLVDDEDFETLSGYKWYRHVGGYAARGSTAFGSALMHREIMKAKKGQIVDHINRNKLDNRKSNLRICTTKENVFNTAKRNVVLTSKYKGVHFDKDRNKYIANISIDNKSTYLGGYEKEEDAAYYYNENAKILQGEFAVLNELPEGYTPTSPFMSKISGRYSSIYRGVSYKKCSNRWSARVYFPGGHKHVGTFSTERIAAEMYNVVALDVLGDKAKLNVFRDVGIIE